MRPLNPSMLAPFAVAMIIASGADAQTANAGFTAFRTVCGDAAAEIGAVRKASEGNGWSDTEVKSTPGMPGVTISERLTRETRSGKGSLLMSAWSGVHKNGAKVSDCAVHADKTSFAAVRDATAGWLAFSPQDSSPTKAIFRFTDADGGHHPITSAEYDAAAKAGGLEILTVSPDGDGAMLDLLVIRK